MLSLAVPHVAFSAPVVDVAMAPTYDRLVTKVLDGISSRGPDSAPHWIAIGGGPGSGKSTLADAVAARVNAALGLAQPPACVVLPMDGFHYSRAQLRELDPPDASEFLPRRGAPWTFDADDCFAQFSAAKRAGEWTLPTYSRELSDPVPGGVQLQRHHKLVLLEGNYLLMRQDPRWAPLDALWDERWFIKCADAAARRQRLILRHYETWNDEKSARWGAGLDGAAARADANDVLNMELIAPSEAYAELVIESV